MTIMEDTLYRMIASTPISAAAADDGIIITLLLVAALIIVCKPNFSRL